DFSRAGQICTYEDEVDDCQVGGVAGREYCGFFNDTYEWKWTQCLTETCDTEGAQRDCDGGVQFCAKFIVDDEGAAEQRWGACGEPGECAPGDSEACFPGEGEFEGLDMYCTSDANGRPVWDYEACNTPLVLSFDGALEFTPAPTTAAAFDIHGGTGTCVRADWPTAATPWLALDRDGDGQIAGGQELFGSATRMPAGTGAHNGFQALAELDSNRDGKISPTDARWGELVLWADHDADRVSTQWELLPLASFEVVEIDLGYSDRPSCDANGNCGRERAAFVYRTGGAERSGEVIDVRVSCE
ncbi:MAG TPA: hypothetical protein VGB85_06225, partial [Nannocystis sp.]